MAERANGGAREAVPGQACAACGSTALTGHLAVAGDAGEEGLIPTTDRYGTALADIVRCARCGHMQLDRFPAEEELSESYTAAESFDYVEEERGQRATAAAMLAEIERHVARGSLCDLGCWVGFLVDEAARRGWDAVGIEPSEFAAAYARSRVGTDVRVGDLFAVELADRAFDAIVLADVIEHLPRAGEALGRTAELLAPGGVLALALPDAGSRLARAMGARWWSVIPTHVHYFTRRSLATMLDRHGYDVLFVGTAPKTFTVRYYAGRLGGYSDAVASGLVRAVELTGIADRLWTPDFRDRMLVIARPR